MSEPKAFRPKRNLYLALAVQLEGDEYLLITVDEMVSRIMKATGGSIDPKQVRDICEELHAEAGVSV